jgi:hypothetical protein
MKKIVPILLSLVMLAAVMHFSVATHYCGGKIAETKVSLTGKLASCGMEDDDNDLPLTGTHYTTHCCDNILVFFGINSNYFPSFASVTESYQPLQQTFSIPADLTLLSLTSVNSIYTSVSPPDALVSTSVDLSDICVFRI